MKKVDWQVNRGALRAMALGVLVAALFTSLAVLKVRSQYKLFELGQELSEESQEYTELNEAQRKLRLQLSTSKSRRYPKCCGGRSRNENPSERDFYRGHGLRGVVRRVSWRFEQMKQGLGAWLAIALLWCSACVPPQQVKDEEPEKQRPTAWWSTPGIISSKRMSELQRKTWSSRLDEDAKHPGANFLMGLIYFGRFRSTQAERDFRRSESYFIAALEADPTYGEARNNLGALYLEVQQWEAAIEALEPLLNDRYYSTPYLAYNNMGWAFFNLLQLKSAEYHFQWQAVAIEPNMCLAHSHLGQVYRAMGRNDVAVIRLDRAILDLPRME